MVLGWQTNTIIGDCDLKPSLLAGEANSASVGMDMARNIGQGFLRDTVNRHLHGCRQVWQG